MSSSVMTSAGVQRLPLSRILIAGLVAIVAAVFANIMVYVIASALGAFPATFINPQTGRAIGIPEVASSSTVGAIGATIVFALLVRFTRRPITIFRVVALVVLILSFAMPLVLNAPLAMLLTLELMHIVAAAVIVWVLTVWAPSR